LPKAARISSENAAKAPATSFPICFIDDSIFSFVSSVLSFLKINFIASNILFAFISSTKVLILSHFSQPFKIII
jgi:hypothetical protein